MSVSSLKSPISRSTLADSVYDTLLEAIVSGRLQTQAVLTSVQLASQLQVSRTPVQEALRRLAASGLVECSTGHRARVVRFSREDAIEIYELRILLEGESAARAASRIAPEELKEMHEKLDALLATTSDVDWCHQALDCDLWFHERLAAAAESPRLQADIERYRLLVRSFCRMVGSAKNLRDAAEEHLHIVIALEKGSGEQARQAMRRHIEKRLEVVLSEAFSESSESA